MTKTMTILGQEVLINQEDHTATFEKNGEQITIQIDLFRGVYSSVYSAMKAKGNPAEKGFYKVGNFLYKREDNTVTVMRSNKEVIGTLEVKEDEKYVRTQVVNYLINALE